MKQGQLLIAAPGLGKTFILAAMVARMVESKWHIKRGCVSPWPYIVVTKASVVEQTKRVFEKFFNLKHNREVYIINIDSLRAEAGSRFIEEKIEVENGVEHLVFKWRDLIRPAFVGWDECHSLKNHSSKQSQIAQAANDVDDIVQFFMSATPGGKVNDFKCFVVSTRIKYQFPGTAFPTTVTNENWDTFASLIAAPSKPSEYCTAAVDRLMDYLDEYIVRVSGVKPQFKAINKVELINFSSKEGKDFYEKCIDTFEKKKQKLEAKYNEGEISGNIYKCGMLTAMLRYRIAAESNPDRVKTICDRMYDDVMQHGKAAACGASFRVSICNYVEYLIKEKGVSRDDISIIWGGGVTKETENQKAKKILTENDEIAEAMKAAGLTLEMLNLEDEEIKEQKTYDDSWRLGMQSLKERQKEIDRFQAGKTLFCFYIFKSGGVGLSLHHTDELTKEKVRHKKSGYAVEEDIPKIPTRPRRVYLAPTWSPFEMVQALGRVPRLTSLSNTEQHLIFFRDTVEERVAEVVSKGLRCFTKVVRIKEDWQDMIINRNFKSQIVDEPEEDNTELLGISEEENEE